MTRSTVYRLFAGEGSESPDGRFVRPRHLGGIADVIEFAQLPDAMRRMRTRETTGRTIIRMSDEA